MAVFDRHAIERLTPALMRPLRLGVLMALGALGAPVRAADLYWDVNGSTTGLGGTGIWNLSNLFWGTNSNGTSLPYSAWNNLALDNAIFARHGRHGDAERADYRS